MTIAHSCFLIALIVLSGRWRFLQLVWKRRGSGSRRFPSRDTMADCEAPENRRALRSLRGLVQKRDSSCLDPFRSGNRMIPENLKVEPIVYEDGSWIIVETNSSLNAHMMVLNTMAATRLPTHRPLHLRIGNCRSLRVPKPGQMHPSQGLQLAPARRHRQRRNGCLQSPNRSEPISGDPERALKYPKHGWSMALKCRVPIGRVSRAVWYWPCKKGYQLCQQSNRHREAFWGGLPTLTKGAWKRALKAASTDRATRRRKRPAKWNSEYVVRRTRGPFGIRKSGCGWGTLNDKPPKVGGWCRA